MIRIASIVSVILIVAVASFKAEILIVAAHLLMWVAIFAFLSLTIWLTFIFADVQRGPSGWR